LHTELDYIEVAEDTIDPEAEGDGETFLGDSRRQSADTGEGTTCGYYWTENSWLILILMRARLGNTGLILAGGQRTHCWCCEGHDWEKP